MTYANEEFLSAISNNYITYLIESRTPYLGEIMLDIDGALRCDGQKIPLHNIVQNQRNKFWRFSSFWFLDPLFTKYTGIYLNTCFDSQGFNLLHRAVLGGHPDAVKYFLSKSMDVLTLSKNNPTILSMSITSAPFTRNGTIPLCITNCSRYQAFTIIHPKKNSTCVIAEKASINFDETATIILEQMKMVQHLKTADVLKLLCNNGQRKFGLIHLAAAKGMLIFLQKSNTGFW